MPEMLCSPRVQEGAIDSTNCALAAPARVEHPHPHRVKHVASGSEQRVVKEIEQLLARGELHPRLLEEMRVVPSDSRQSVEFQDQMEKVARRLFPDHSWNAEPVAFILCDNPEANACCIPAGGRRFIFLNTGLFLKKSFAERFLETEDQLAFILAHEWFHAELRPQLIAQGVGRGGKPEESICDMEATRAMSAAGYDPRAGVAVLEKFGNASSSTPRIVKILLDEHPTAENRIRAVEAVLEELRREGLLRRWEEGQATSTRLSGLLTPSPIISLAKEARHSSWLDQRLAEAGYSRLNTYQKTRCLLGLLKSNAEMNPARIGDLEKAIKSLPVDKNRPAQVGALRRLTKECWRHVAVDAELYAPLYAACADVTKHALGQGVAPWPLQELAHSASSFIKAQSFEQALLYAQEMRRLVALRPELASPGVCNVVQRTLLLGFKNTDIGHTVSWNNFLPWAENDESRAIEEGLLRVGAVDSRILSRVELDVATTVWHGDFARIGGKVGGGITCSQVDSNGKLEETYSFSNLEVSLIQNAARKLMLAFGARDLERANMASRLLSSCASRFEHSLAQILDHVRVKLQADDNIRAIPRVVSEFLQSLSDSQQEQEAKRISSEVLLSLRSLGIVWSTDTLLEPQLLAEGSDMRARFFALNGAALSSSREARQEFVDELEGLAANKTLSAESIRTIIYDHRAEYGTWPVSSVVAASVGPSVSAEPIAAFIFRHREIFRNDDCLHLVNRHTDFAPLIHEGDASLAQPILALLRLFVDGTGFQAKREFVGFERWDSMGHGVFSDAHLYLEAIDNFSKREWSISEVAAFVGWAEMLPAALGGEEAFRYKLREHAIARIDQVATQPDLRAAIATLRKLGSSQFLPLNVREQAGLQLLSRLQRVRDTSTRLELLEDLAASSRNVLGKTVDTPKFQQLVYELWSDAAMETFGLDHGRPGYFKRVDDYLNRISKKLSHWQVSQLYPILAEKLQVQPELAYRMEKQVAELPLSLWQYASMGGTAIEGLHHLITSSDSLRRHCMDFLTATLSKQSTDRFLAVIKEEAKKSMFGLSTKESRYSQLHKDSMARDGVELIYKVFWELPLGLRAVAARELLFDNAAQNNAKEYERVTSELLLKAIPASAPQAEKARKVIRIHLQGLPEYSQQLALSALMVAARAEAQDHATPLPEKVAMLLDAMGPLEIKTKQLGANSPHVGSEWRRAFKSSQFAAAPVPRWTVLHWAEDRLPREWKNQKVRYGPQRGSGSLWVSLELQVAEGLRILSLKRPNSKEKAEMGAAHLRRTLKDAAGAGVVAKKTARALASLIDRSERLCLRELEEQLAPAQHAQSQDRYNIAAVVEGKRFTFGAARLDAVGDGYKIQELIAGHHMAETPSTTWDEKEHRRKLFLAFVTVELNLILRRIFDVDRQGGNAKANGTHVGHFDLGGVELEPYPLRSMKSIAKTAVRILLRSSNSEDLGEQLLGAFSGSRLFRDANTESSVSRALSSIGEFLGALTREEQTKCLLAALDYEVEPAMRKAIERTVRWEVFRARLIGQKLKLATQLAQPNGIRLVGLAF